MRWPFEYDFRSSLAEDAETGLDLDATLIAAETELDNGGHRLADRVERVDLVQVLLRHLDAEVLVILPEIIDKPQQRTLRLVADLLR